MTIYNNAGNDKVIIDDIGSPTLGASDIVNIMQGSLGYTESLGSLGSTAFAEFNAGPGFSGMIGNYPAGLLVQAGIIRLGSASAHVAIKGDAVGTVTLMEWANTVGGQCTIADYAVITRLNLMTSGKFIVEDSSKVVSAYVAGPGMSAVFEDGDAATLIEVGAPRGAGMAQAQIMRDTATLSVFGNGLATIEESCSPATVNVYGGTLRHAGDGALGTINVWAGSTIDLSKLQASLAGLTWVVNGDFTLIMPAAGLSVDEPTSGELGSFRMSKRYV